VRWLLRRRGAAQASARRLLPRGPLRACHERSLACGWPQHHHHPPRPTTLLRPTRRTDRNALQNLLQYHIFDGRALRAGQLKENQTLTMMNGEKVTVHVSEKCVLRPRGLRVCACVCVCGGGGG
jgi:hypothetical protein